jgi:hypothetical protein
VHDAARAYQQGSGTLGNARHSPQFSRNDVDRAAEWSKVTMRDIV